MHSFLSIRWDVNPEIFSLGAIHLRYYGVLLVGGFVLAYFVLRNIFRREQLPPVLFDNFAMTAVISTLVGLRLGHFLFYQPSAFLTNPLEIILPVRFSPHFEFTGYQGLASHGGAAGILLGLLWWSRKRKIPYLWALERIVLVVPLAGAFVRIGNLMNSEVYGAATALPWGFIFMRNAETVPHHPTQLYEATAYFLIFFIMRYLYTKQLPKLKRGMLFGVFLILLFGARFAIEFIKEPQVQFEENMFFNMGQWLSLPFIVAGLAFLRWGWKYGKPEAGWIPCAAAGKQPAMRGKQPPAGRKPNNRMK
ncbi:MAG: prolipoprotein diacylglyceryl transferase [Prevotellaceae bacterium]|jgi:prolipoprotein diacylglyceryl transferase|nr:prolipoprotein diacylglyceryl transferase [Prevotellaceae bacterium]